MWGRQANDTRRIGILVAIAGSSLFVALCLLLIFMQRWFTSSSVPVQSSQNLPAEAEGPESTSTVPKSLASPLPTVQPSQVAPSSSASNSDSSSAGSVLGNSSSADRQGVLRISNPTGYPVRVALLPQKASSNAASGNNNRAGSLDYDIPAHWDFAPQEGATNGLIVSLPNRKLKVKKGDILVAFAQDGSRRYWGPYVVGETDFPSWNTKTDEWQLILQP